MKPKAFPDLILASGSPRRRELFRDLGWPFSIILPQVDESLLPGEAPEKAVERLARLKTLSVDAAEGAWVVAADTVVAVGGTVLGKPVDRSEGLGMIRLLAGRTHAVHSGVALACSGRLFSASERTEVSFRSLSEEEMKAYVDTGEGDDKAGSYAIQGRGSLLVDAIRGCYFNVVGLPLARLSRLFVEAGLKLDRQWRLN
jgi:septum formation protein